MSKSKLQQLSAQEKMDLLASLEALLGCVKSLHATVGAVMQDVAAIRNTVFDDPDDITTYRVKIRNAVTTARPRVKEALSSYDELLEEIADAQRFAN
jgi:hypothetical protein